VNIAVKLQLRNAPSFHEWVFYDEWLDSREEAVRWRVEHERE